MANNGAAAAVPIASLDRIRSDEVDGDWHRRDDRVLEPVRYLAQVPGKNVRGKLIDAFQAWLDVPAEHVGTIKSIVGRLHNASLLIDDIEDSSQLRRGRAVAHSIYGLPTTLNAANYEYFLALEECVAMNDAAALRVFTRELLNLHRGQGLDILWRDTGRCPSEEEYIAMVLDKTGGLFRLAVGLMSCFSKSKENFIPLVDMMALFFQVRDDVINLASPKYQENKSFCEDLSEGKFSLPAIHSINLRPEDTRVLSILKQRTQSREVKQCAVDWMRKETRSFAYCGAFLDDLKSKIYTEIERLGGHPVLVALVERIASDLDDCEL